MMMKVLVLLMAVTIAMASGDWMFDTAKPAPADIFSVVYANSNFLAVGEQSTIITSHDGMKWSVEDSPNPENQESFEYITYDGEDLYILGGSKRTPDNYVFLSGDSVWTSTDNAFRAIANSPKLALGVAMEPDSVKLKNLEDDTWTSVSPSSPLEQPDNGLRRMMFYQSPVYNGDEDEFAVLGIVLTYAGDDIVTNATTVSLFRSSDGISWTETPIDESGECLGRLPHLEYSYFGRGYIYFGCGVLAVTGDGTTWTHPSCSGDHCDMSDVVVTSLSCSKAGRCVATAGVSARAVGRDVFPSECRIVESDDGGSSWAITEACGSFASLSAGPHVTSTANDGSESFVIVNGDSIFFSNEARKWTDVTVTIEPSVNTLFYDNGSEALVATSTYNNGFVYSTDGNMWFSVDTDQPLREIVSRDSVSVGIATNGFRNYLVVSGSALADANEWKTVKGEDSETMFHSLHYHESSDTFRCWSISKNGDTRVSEMLTSTDGYEWTSEQLELNVYPIEWVASKDHYIGSDEDGNTLLVTDDGVLWEPVQNVTGGAQSMAVSPEGVCVALCRCGVVVSSDGGISWSDRDTFMQYGLGGSFDSISKITYNEALSKFIATGSVREPKADNDIFGSSDGALWTRLSFPYAYTTLSAASFPDNPDLYIIANQRVMHSHGAMSWEVVTGINTGVCNSIPSESAQDTANSSTLSTEDIVLICVTSACVVAVLVSAVFMIIAYRRASKKQDQWEQRGDAVESLI